MNVAACVLPNKLLRLQGAAGKRHSVQAAVDWAHADVIIRRHPVDLIVVDPQFDTKSEARSDRIRAFHDRYRSLPMIVYSVLAAQTLRPLIELGQDGVEQVVLLRSRRRPAAPAASARAATGHPTFGQAARTTVIPTEPFARTCGNGGRPTHTKSFGLSKCARPGRRRRRPTTVALPPFRARRHRHSTRTHGRGATAPCVRLSPRARVFARGRRQSCPVHGRGRANPNDEVGRRHHAGSGTRPSRDRRIRRPAGGPACARRPATHHALDSAAPGRETLACIELPWRRAARAL